MAIKIFTFDSSHDFSWIKDSVSCSVINDANIIYIGGHQPVSLSLLYGDEDISSEKFEQCINNNYYNKCYYNILKCLPSDKLIITVDAGAILAGIMIGELFDFTDSNGSRSSDIIFNKEYNLICLPMLINCQQFLFTANTIKVLGSSYVFDRYPYNFMLKSYPPIVWQYKNIIGIHAYPEIMNRNPKSISIQYLNQLIKERYENL